ncbi:lipid-A-disaccharide synthase [Portibacter marinus]|uniref:lipid-A-disaccharide synthase n=1 Tax=Portibacter marinus TaxID=2898660 RepID=UPI001F167F0E|nr:lipid-A-disaccharide synthase [Portibacter marinus]
MHKIFLIAGEASGDLHGSHLVSAMLATNKKIKIAAYGGKKMAAAGAEVLRNYEAFSYMGFLEVFSNLNKILRNLTKTAQLIEDFAPDAIVFIDFPGFNLRIASRLRKMLVHTKFYYYISPKVWAWKSSRIHKLAKWMDRIFVIFPFEEDFYRKFGYEATYVGNPLLDSVNQEKSLQSKTKGLIAVLPGSRRQEIEKMLPIFASLSKEMPQLQFEVSVMPHFELSFYRDLTSKAGQNFTFSKRTTYELLDKASAALVTSGTATLETALFHTPQIVAYKTSMLSYEIGKRVIQTKYISLVNLILDKPAVPELIQNELTIDKLKYALTKLIRDNSQMLSDYQELHKKLGKPGASKRTASFILEDLE